MNDEDISIFGGACGGIVTRKRGKRPGQARRAAFASGAAVGWAPTRVGGPAKSDYLNDLDEGDRIQVRLAVNDE